MITQMTNEAEHEIVQCLFPQYSAKNLPRHAIAYLTEQTKTGATGGMDIATIQKFIEFLITKKNYS